MTIEHALGRKNEEAWNCVILCWYHHLGKGLKKELNRMIAYQQSTEDNLNKYPKSKPLWLKEKAYLEGKYPEYIDKKTNP